MLVILPPSEGKAAPAAGAAHGPVDLAALAHPELGERRLRLIGILDRLATHGAQGTRAQRRPGGGGRA